MLRQQRSTVHKENRANPSRPSRDDEEMTKWLNALVALAEDPDSNPSTNMVANNHLQLQFQWIQCPLLTSTGTKKKKKTTGGTYINMQAKHTYK